MKNIQLLSIVFSLIMFTGVTAGTAVAYAESDDSYHDFDDRLEYFCEMTDSEKEQLFDDHPRLAQFEDRLANYCDLDEMEREDLIKEFIEEHFADYKEKGDWDMDDILDRYCEMSPEDQAAFLEKYPMASEHQDKMTEYCLLDESGREAYIEEHKGEYSRVHDYDIKTKLDKFCEMSADELAALVEEHGKGEDHLADMEEYCTLDEAGREAFIEEHEDEYKKHDYNIREKMNEFCEMSEDNRAAHLEKYQKSEEHLTEMEEFCSLDDAGQDAFIEEHKDSMGDKMSDHKDTMTNKMCEHGEDMECKMSDHKDSMGDNMSDHKDSMGYKMSDHKDIMTDKMCEHEDCMGCEMCEDGDCMGCKMSDHKNSMSSDRKHHTVLKASTLTDEQKNDIREMHSDLRDMKHSLRDKSIDDVTKQDIRDQFMEKAKEFSMTWLSPRHQVSAGIDAQMVECRENFALVMKTSNASPICVKETTAEKLIERGIAISAI